jgi:hypothetical protein
MVKKGVKGVALVEVGVLRILPLNVIESMKNPTRIIKTAKNVEEVWDWAKGSKYRKRIRHGEYIEVGWGK